MTTTTTETSITRTTYVAVAMMPTGKSTITRTDDPDQLLSWTVQVLRDGGVLTGVERTTTTEPRGLKPGDRVIVTKADTDPDQRISFRPGQEFHVATTETHGGVLYVWLIETEGVILGSAVRLAGDQSERPAR